MLWLLVYVTIAAGAFYYLQQRGADHLWLRSSGGALAAWLSLGFVIGILKTMNERSMVSRAMGGEPPEEGKRVAIVGSMSSSHDLRAPFSRAEVVAYRYRIWRVVHQSNRSGSSSSTTTLFEGTALVPSTIISPSGTHRLLAVPDFDFALEEQTGTAAERNAAEYLLATEFQQSKGPQDLTAAWTDDDGAFRQDIRQSELDFDISTCHLSEGVVRKGERVCVVGRYSRQRGGIVPDENWGKRARIIKGTGDEVRSRLAGRILGYLVGAVIFGSAAFAIVRFI